MPCPEDGVAGTLIGRAWAPAAGGRPAGPRPVVVREDGIFDLSGVVATCAELVASGDGGGARAGRRRGAPGPHR